MTARARVGSPRWWVYLVRCRGGDLYTGIATDVARRFAEHASGGPRAARFLRGRGPLTLVLRRRLGSLGLALRVERAIKRLPRSAKEDLVAEPDRLLAVLERVRRDRRREQRAERRRAAARSTQREARRSARA